MSISVLQTRDELMSYNSNVHIVMALKVYKSISWSVLILTALNKAIEFYGKIQVLGIPEKDLKLKPHLNNYI